MLDPLQLVFLMVHPEKASQPWCQGCEHGVCLSMLRLSSETVWLLSPGSSWCSHFWSLAELWPLQCSLPAGPCPTPSLNLPPGRWPVLRAGAAPVLSSCPAPGWGGGMGPARPSMGSPHHCALTWVNLCISIQRTVDWSSVQLRF